MTSSQQKIHTVMIIDDNEIDHLLYRRIIKRSNRVDNIISFTYADEALEFLKRKDRENIDIIFLDINMPRMDGFEFLAAATEQLGNSFADAVVVMLTTSMAERDKERARQYDIVKAYLNKPLAADHLQFVAEEILFKSAGQSQLEQTRVDKPSEDGS